MARVLISSQSWGVVQDRQGVGQSGLTATITRASDSTSATVYSALTGSTTTTPVTNSDGEIAGYIEEGTYSVSIGGESFRVEAVAGTSGGIFRPRTFGAVGDGTTSDNAAIAACLSALSAAGGGVLEVEADDWHVITDITIPSQTEIRCAGGWTGGFKIAPTGSALEPFKIAAGSTDIRVHDIAIDGNKANISGDSTVLGSPAFQLVALGTAASPCQRVYFERIYSFNAKRLGLSLKHVKAGAVRNCLCQDHARDGITIYYGCKDVDVSGNTVERCGDDGIGVNSEEASSTNEGITVTGNTILGPGIVATSDERGPGITLRGGKGITVAGNVVRDVAQSGIKVENAAGNPAEDIAITGNVVIRSGYEGATDKDGIYLHVPLGSTTYIRNVKVTGNVVDGALNIGIRLYNEKASPADDDLADVFIEGNLVKSSAQQGIAIGSTGINDIDITNNRVKSSGAAGIYCEAAAKRVHVEGNRVQRPTGRGIHLSTVAGVSCKGNMVYDDRGGSSTMTHGLTINALTGEIDIGENRIWGATTANFENLAGHSGTAPRPWRQISGSTTWNPASVADGAMTSTTVTVTGAEVGDVATAGFSQAVPAGVALTASVTAANTLTVTLTNHSGGAVDLASGTLRGFVEKFL